MTLWEALLLGGLLPPGDFLRPPVLAGLVPLGAGGAGCAGPLPLSGLAGGLGAVAGGLGAAAGGFAWGFAVAAVGLVGGSCLLRLAAKQD